MQVIEKLSRLQQDYQVLETKHRDYVLETARVAGDEDEMEALQDKLTDKEAEISSLEQHEAHLSGDNKQLHITNNELVWVSL